MICFAAERRMFGWVSRKEFEEHLSVPLARPLVSQNALLGTHSEGGPPRFVAKQRSKVLFQPITRGLNDRVKRGKGLDNASKIVDGRSDDDRSAHRSGLQRI